MGTARRLLWWLIEGCTLWRHGQPHVAQLGNIYYVKSTAGRTGGISSAAPLMTHRGMHLVTSRSPTCGATRQYLLCKINSWSLSCNHTDRNCTIVVYMSFEIIFPFCLVPHISMNSVYMFFETSFLCCLVITLITTVPHISMKRVYMCFEISFPFSWTESICLLTFLFRFVL